MAIVATAEPDSAVSSVLIVVVVLRLVGGVQV